MKEVKELRDWMFPGATCDAVLTGAPMVYAHLRTETPIERVCAFYRKKAARDASYGEPARRNEVYWGDQTDGGSGLNGGGSPVRGVNVCLYVVRSARQTVTIQVSRDPERPHQTQIVLIGSAR